MATTSTPHTSQPRDRSRLRSAAKIVVFDIAGAPGGLLDGLHGRRAKRAGERLAAAAALPAAAPPAAELPVPVGAPSRAA